MRFLYNTQPSSPHLKVASVAMLCSEDLTENLRHIALTVSNITSAHSDVDLIVFGEMSLNWYQPGINPKHHQKNSQPIPGPFIQAIADLAIQKKTNICFGMSEKYSGHIYNSQVLINPMGEIQALHRKKNLKRSERLAGYLPGDVPVTITSINGIKTAMMVCSDAASLHTIRSVMQEQPQLVILSLADDDQDDFMAVLQSRLYDSWVVTANRFGQEAERFWPGQIFLSDPLGKIQKRSIGKEQFLFHDLRFDQSTSPVRKWIRCFFTRAPIPFILLCNLKKIRSYF